MTDHQLGVLGNHGVNEGLDHVMHVAERPEGPLGHLRRRVGTGAQRGQPEHDLEQVLAGAREIPADGDGNTRICERGDDRSDA